MGTKNVLIVKVRRRITWVGLLIVISAWLVVMRLLIMGNMISD